MKMVVDLNKLIGKRDMNLTISCGSEFFIKNDNDVICIFSTYQGVEEIYLFVQDNVNNQVPSIVISFGWDVGEVEVEEQFEGQIGGQVRRGGKVEGDVGGQVRGEKAEVDVGGQVEGKVEEEIGSQVGERVDVRKSASLHIVRKDNVPTLSKEIYLFVDSNDIDWMTKEKLNDGNKNDSNDGNVMRDLRMMIVMFS